jgi:hypothetical protein
MAGPLFLLTYVGGAIAGLAWLMFGRHVTPRGVFTVALTWVTVVVLLARIS